MKKVNMQDLSDKLTVVYGDECEKNVVGIIIYENDGEYFFDKDFKHYMSNEEVEALLLRGAVIEKDGVFHSPASFNNEIVSLSAGNGHVLTGKSMVCVGDSITTNSNTTRTYWQILEEIIDLSSMVGMGVGGSCVSSKSDYGITNQPLINRYEQIPEADVITIFIGTNDYGHETPLGSISDTTDVSFYGALNVIIPNLMAMHPNSKIIFITPLHRYGFGTSSVSGEAFTYDHVANGTGHTLKDYVDAIKEVCGRYGVPVIDLFNTSGMQPSLPHIKSTYFPDGLHPNELGHTKIAYIIKEWLNIYCADLNFNAEEPDVPEEPDIPEEPDVEKTYVTLTLGNDYYAQFADNSNRASIQPYAILVPEGVTVKPKDGYLWIVVGNVDVNNMPSGEYLWNDGWQSRTYTGTGAYVGISFKKEDDSDFDFSVDSVNAIDYFDTSDPSIFELV